MVQGNLQSQSSKVKSSLIEQLNSYIFIFMQKALTYYEIGTVPIYYEYLLNLQKVASKQPCQLDMFIKNKL